jgi:hypothetical protein
MPNDQIATKILVSGEIRLDPPGIIMTVDELYID